MTTVRCTYANYDTVTTRFNGTFEEAKAYFLNQSFNIGSVEDNMQKCVKVQEVCRYCLNGFDPEGKPEMCREAPASVLYHAGRND